MKKLYAITVCILLCMAGTAQPYAPWEPSQGPLNFMTLDVLNHPYIRLSYNEFASGINNYESNTVPGPNPHHQLIATNGQDPCRCYGLGTNYVYENYFPTSDIITKPNGAQVDTIIRLGNTSLNSNSQIEYWFYPQVNESTLLVCFSFAEEDVIYHSASVNPRFYIEVLDGQTNQLIQSGYYPTEAATIAGNPTPTNNNWPYSRFLAVPSGENSGQDHSVWSDNLQSYVYYWAFPQATPTTWDYRICPASQTSGISGSYDVKWLEYKPIAFDLSEYAAQGKSVKLRIRNRTCEYFAHWSYSLFYAKMVSGGGTVAATDDNPVFHLSVPTGFMENTYEWHYGYDSLDASNRILDEYNTPVGITIPSVYDIFIDPDTAIAGSSHVWPYYRCEVRSYTGVPFVFEYWLRRYHLDADFSYQHEDNGDAVQFQNLSTLFYSTPPAAPNAGWDTVYEDGHLRWYVLENGAFTLFAENESNPSFTFTPTTVSDGEATVMLVVSDSLNQVSDTVVRSFPMSLTGIPAHERGSVTVTPNPTRGTVRVTADRDIENVRILNADGKQLNTITPHNRTTTLDLGHYDGNLFLLEVRFKDGGNVVKKVVKR